MEANYLRPISVFFNPNLTGDLRDRRRKFNGSSIRTLCRDGVSCWSMPVHRHDVVYRDSVGALLQQVQGNYSGSSRRWVLPYRAMSCKADSHSESLKFWKMLEIVICPTWNELLVGWSWVAKFNHISNRGNVYIRDTNLSDIRSLELCINYSFQAIPALSCCWNEYSTRINRFCFCCASISRPMRQAWGIDRSKLESWPYRLACSR